MKDLLKSGAARWKSIVAIVAFLAVPAISSYFAEGSNAQAPTSGTFLSAQLTGPAINGVTPSGVSRYAVDTNNNRFFETHVNSVNLPGGTILTVFVDGSSAGQIRLGSFRSGVLRLSTTMGQTVPNVSNGSAIAIKNGSVTILSGTFAIPPTPTPFPSPSGSPYPSPTAYPTPSVALFAPLSGPTINGIMPRGLAQYAEFGTTSRRLGVFVGHVHLPQGTHLGVFIDGTQVGEIILNDDGHGGLRLDTAQGHTVPVITAGSTAQVRNGSTVILSGTFQTGPPMPTPSPSATPTPHPSPGPNRFFAGRLNGAQVVPPVATEGRGAIFVVLNETGTEIRVWLGFYHLSSAQTTARIHGPAMPGENGPQIFDLGTVGGTFGRFPVRTFAVTPVQREQLRNGLWYVQIGSVNHPNGEIRGQIRSHTRPSGFSGAERQDVGIFRPSNGTWYVKNGGGYSVELLGQPGDVPVSGDFDGDGVTDHAVFRNGTWLIRRSSDNGRTTRQFGLAGDIPVRGDYDGDGAADLAVFRPSTGIWYIEKSNGTGYVIMRFGVDGDQPVASDFDGDGKTDIAVFRQSTGVWYWMNSRSGEFRATQFGSNGDVPIAGDFDGDGADDVSVYRPSTGVWYITRSSDGRFDIRQYGLSSDVPVAADYDGDGVSDIAVFRQSEGVWYIWRSSDDRTENVYFGSPGDIPFTRN